MSVYDSIAISTAIISLWWMGTSEPFRNLQVNNHTLKIYVINPLVHIYQNEKWYSQGPAADIACVNMSSKPLAETF